MSNNISRIDLVGSSLTCLLLGLSGGFAGGVFLHGSSYSDVARAVRDNDTNGDGLLDKLEATNVFVKSEDKTKLIQSFRGVGTNMLTTADYLETLLKGLAENKK